ncbi:hypothetical protein ACQPYE_20095 [Actinosynnema sp. CA-299493]
MPSAVGGATFVDRRRWTVVGGAGAVGTTSWSVDDVHRAYLP